MKTSCICTSFTTAILILASCLTHLATSSRCTIDLQTHKITRRGNKYHIKVDNGEDKVYTLSSPLSTLMWYLLPRLVILWVCKSIVQRDDVARWVKQLANINMAVVKEVQMQLVFILFVQIQSSLVNSVAFSFATFTVMRAAL